MLNKVNYQDTIAAISTPIGAGGISIVRLSGKDAIRIADQIFISKSNKKLAKLKSHKACFGKIIDEGNRIIDETIVTLMRAPKTYTKEDIVEINCHGGIIVTREILNLLTRLGARLAEPGEFTMRAFLNGRIDLVQAEAVRDIIEAKTKRALDLSLCNLEGKLSKKINSLAKKTLNILSLLEAKINFPEEKEVEESKESGILKKLKLLDNELKDLIKTEDQSRIVKEGVNVVICGKANVGKSSLLNAFLEKNRSIVSSIPGTTRDTIEELINVDGVLVKITDTAGIKDASDEIEKEAILRTKKSIKNADIIFFVVDAAIPLSSAELDFIKKLKNKNLILVANKIDLSQRIDLSKLNVEHKVFVSALKRKNLDKLKKLVVDLIWDGKIDENQDCILTSLRQLECLKKSQFYLENAAKSIKENLPLEFVACDVKDALDELDSVTGRNSSQEVLDNIFSKFCIGK